MEKNINIYNKIPEKSVLDKEESKKITGYATIDKPWQKYYTKEAIEAPIPEMTAYEYMKSENMDNLSTTAIEYYGTKISFKKYIELIDEAARKFYNLGVSEGDIVTVMSVANPELEIAFYALNKLGAIINLIDVRSDSKTVKGYLNEVKSDTMICLDNFLPEVDKIIDETNVKHVITVSPFNSIPPLKKCLANINDKNKNKELRNKIDEIKKKDKYITWNNFMQIPLYKYPKYPSYQENKMAALVHTGGTTGVSKTVKLSNENFNAMAIQYKSLNTGYNKKDTFLNGIVPFVAYGIVDTIHMPMCLGITNIIAPILSPQEFTDFMIKYKPNHTITVPSYVDDFIKNPKAGNMEWSSLKHLGVGGDMLTKEKESEINKFLEKHNANITIEKGYGMTELSSGAITTLGKTNKPISLGIPLPKNSIGIFKENTDNELKYGEEGEICITGPTRMLGYLNNEEEESKVLQVHSDGKIWVHSGDLGMLDEDGFLYLKGRIKRMIIHGGFKLYPAKIEDVIDMHENVDKCCVISIPSTEFGSSPEAHVVLKNKNKEELQKIKEELIELCKDNLPDYSIPEDFIFEEDLPLTTVGKVDYKKVEKDRVKKLVKESK